MAVVVVGVGVGGTIFFEDEDIVDVGVDVEVEVADSLGFWVVLDGFRNRFLSVADGVPEAEDLVVLPVCDF